MFCGELGEGKQNTSKPTLRYMDCVKSYLVKCQIPVGEWERLAADRGRGGEGSLSREFRGLRKTGYSMLLTSALFGGRNMLSHLAVASDTGGTRVTDFGSHWLV